MTKLTLAQLIGEILYEIKYSNPNFNNEWEEAERYPEFVKMGEEEWTKIANQGSPASFSLIKKRLGNVDLNFDSLEEPKKERFIDAFNKGTIEMPIAVKFSNNDYDLVAGNTRLAGLVNKGIDPKIWVVDISHLAENFKDTKVDQQLKNYIEDYTDINLKLLKDLIKLKPKYPQQLDPREGGNKFGYRGTTFNKEFINKLKVKSSSNGTTEYEVPSNLKITSKGKRGFLSFSTDEDVAKGFGHYSGYVDHKKSDDRVGGYVKVSLDNPNFILHPDYMGELSKDMEYSKESEKETLFVGNSYTPESIIVVDEKIYKENFKDGKKKGKSRPGRVKKSGASCNGSVTDLRRKAKNASGEKAKMYHWCANMKSGKK